jgi:hypothetical protein
VSALDVARQSEPEFQKELNERLQEAGFRFDDPIIRQPRSDIDGADFIQFQYSWWDRFDVKLDYFRWRIWKWFKINFTK